MTSFFLVEWRISAEAAHASGDHQRRSPPETHLRRVTVQHRGGGQ